MKKNGFTLVEILAVIAILAVIFAVTVPTFISVIDNTKQQAYDSQADLIVKAAKDYVTQHSLTDESLKTSGVLVSKTLYELNQLNYLELPVKNPLTDTNFDVNRVAVYILRQPNGIYDYCFYDPDNLKRSCEEFTISANEYTDATLNGADPVIKGDLIPVEIASDGTVTRANTKVEWYNYSQKSWANAVILVDDTIYEVGDIIPEEKIESYFVWIPRYEYQIFDENVGNYATTTTITDLNTITSKVQEIKINFGSIENMPAVVGDAYQEWLTHPAFTSFSDDNNSNGVNGLWVAKFETGYKGATNANEAKQKNDSSSNIVVKPSLESAEVYTWRENTVSNFFNAMKNYNTNLNSHMMKNTEWGAVAYLSHSKYGINNEVRINNSSTRETGCAASVNPVTLSWPEYIETTSIENNEGVFEGCQNRYNTETGYLASTTGNITGVYDMSGGAWEYVAAYVSGTYESSGFTTEPATEHGTKYFDVYDVNSTETSYGNRILGDATGELGPFYGRIDTDNVLRYRNSWYKDYSHFADTSYLWFPRGGDYRSGTDAGQFAFVRSTGDIDSTSSARLVLAP